MTNVVAFKQFVRKVNDIKTHINNFDEVIGDIETALDNIIAIQESLIGGGGE